MAASTPSTIILQSVDTQHLKESPANGTITPGDFLERATDGDFQRQSTLGVAGPKLIALENDLTSGLISTDYATGDRVRAAYPKSGDEVYAFVPANAAAIVIGDKLIFDGTGCVKIATSQADLTGTLTGTVDGALANVADIALSTTDTYTDSAVNTAVNAAILDVNLQLKELQTALNAILPANDGVVIATALVAIDNSAVGSKARIKIELV